MAKATKTAKELEAKIMRAAKASGKCRDLLSVTVLPAGILSSNWKIGTASSNQDNHLLSGECRISSTRSSPVCKRCTIWARRS